MTFQPGTKVMPAPGVYLPLTIAVVQKSWMRGGSEWAQVGNRLDSKGADVGVYPASKLREVIV